MANGANGGEGGYSSDRLELSTAMNSSSSSSSEASDEDELSFSLHVLQGASLSKSKGKTASNVKTMTDTPIANKKNSAIVEQIYASDPAMAATVNFLSDKTRFRKILKIFPGSEPGVPLCEQLQEIFFGDRPDAEAQLNVFHL